MAGLVSECHVMLVSRFRAGDVDRGLQLLDSVLSLGYRPGIVTWTVVFRALSESGRGRELERVVRWVRRHGPELDHLAFSTLIHGFCKLGQARTAVRLYRALVARGMQPNSYNHLSLVQALCGLGRPEEASGLVRRLRPAEAALYNAAMHGHGAAGGADAALGLLAEMLKRGVSPTVVTFNTVIHGLCRTGRLEEGRAVKEYLMGRDPGPNTVSYTILLHACCQRWDLSTMVKLFEEMVNRGVAPNAVTYSVIMKGLCRAGHVARSAALLRDMIAKGIPTDEIAFNTLIQGLCEAGEVAQAFRVYDEMVNHARPGPVTYNILVNALCVRGNLRAAEILVAELAAGGGVRLRKFAFTAVIKAHCVMGSPAKAMAFFQKMIAAGFDATVEDYTAVIRRLARRRHLKEVKSFLRMMWRAGIRPDRVLFLTLRQAFSADHDRRSVLVLQGKMITSGQS
ncbi:uncharacterized protein LOC144711737 [Wolffia australiana]